MQNSALRRLVAIAVVGLFLSPGSLAAQEGHAEGGAEAEHALAAEHQGHEDHIAHEKNEIAVFVGGTRRLKFEEDETGATFGIEYMRQIRPRVGASIGAEFAAGNIERDVVAMFKLGVQPFEDWAEPLLFYIGVGVEVARIDEALAEADELLAHGHGEGEGEHGLEPIAAEDEHGGSEERETEVDALMRLGTGWIIHAGSISIIPNLNFDLVGEDWAMVFGLTLGYRF